MRATSHSVTGPHDLRHDCPSACAVRRQRAPWFRAVVALLTCTLCVATGCSGRSGFLTGGPTVGQMKTSLSHLEFENVELKRSMAKLQQENRSMEDRLRQEQIDNGDLTARLDDARNLLRDRGIESDTRL